MRQRQGRSVTVAVAGVAAGLMWLVWVAPAAAQSGPAAVVCVGSELTRESSNPVPRVITEDVAVTYRVGVGADDREEIERTLLAELGDHAEASCLWSNPGDSHVAIIRFTGVLRRDLTLDPDDPRFQAFAVGYGTSAEAAQENATTVSARFATYYDGSGYEVLVAESWAADMGGVATGGDAGAAPEEEAVAPGGQPGATGPAPGTEFSDCDVCPRMVVVPAGTFTMGSAVSEEGRNDDEGPQHSVTIPTPFAVGVFEVTFTEWDACVSGGGCGGSAAADEGWGRGNRPVINVSWDDAQAYVSWLSERTGAHYRLLSEAEWEYAARAGTRTARYWGESDADQCGYANGYNDYGSCSDGHRFTAPVGSFDPNAFGLYDVLGNVAEWTQDCLNEPCYRRVSRGGAWSSLPEELRSASRSGPFSDMGFWQVGFRVARTIN